MTTYSYSSIDYPGAQTTTALGVNNSGQVVGAYLDGGGVHGFLDSNGAFTSISYPGSSSTTLDGINASGQIIGYDEDGAGQNQGFLYSNGAFTPISFPGAISTEPTGINASGQVVGEWIQTSTVFGSFEYSNGTYTSVQSPSVPAGSTQNGTDATGINDAGQISGSYQGGNAPGFYGATPGFVDTNGSYSYFGYPGAYATDNSYINNTGEIAGIYASSANSIDASYTYSNGTFSSFGYPGASVTQIQGLNDGGQLVGVYQDSTGTHGFEATPQLVCYVSGTLIRAVRAGAEADVPVESLLVGDLAVTASGEHHPVRWVGHRTVDCRRHPQPEAVQPIRIRAHALGENRPARDLLLSPGHSVCVDLVGEVLVPASVLVNGATVVREDVDSVTYWHVELDSHDLLLAENLPAESYLDMGNRAFFAGSPVVGLAAVPDGTPASRSHADFCRPFHDGGALVAFLRERLHARAVALGWQLARGDPWAGAHLLVDGARIEGEMRGLSARFALPAGAKEVWLVSNTGVPHELGLNDDGRRLGLCVAGLRLDDGWCEPRAVAPDDPLLCAGFHLVEGEDGGEAGRPHRWTAGRARLPAALWAGWDGPVSLRLDLATPALPRWAAPDTARAAPARPAVSAPAA